MAEKLTQIELDSIQLHETKPRSLAKDVNGFITQEDDVETALGTVKVMVQGDRSKPAIFTYHDIGLNSITCFQSFFNGEEMMPILRHFCVYHINAPGQQEGALPLPQGKGRSHSDYFGRLRRLSIYGRSGMKHSESEKLLTSIGVDASAGVNAAGATAARPKGKRASVGFPIGFTGDPATVNCYQYPSMDQLADMIVPVMQWYNVKMFIGFGVGAGANILARFGLAHPDKVEALVLINCTSSKAGWTEWGYQKLNSWHLRGGSISTSVEDYLLWHWFGNRTIQTNQDLTHVYGEYIKSINPQNLAHFIESYIKRTNLAIVREITPARKATARMIRCPVMLIAGDSSPHLDDTVNMNSRMDPENCQWMKFQCGGMVMEECPVRLAEAYRLFLQGMGYVPSLSQTKLTAIKSARSGGALANGSSSQSGMASSNHSAPTQTVC